MRAGFAVVLCAVVALAGCATAPLGPNGGDDGEPETSPAPGDPSPSPTDGAPPWDDDAVRSETKTDSDPGWPGVNSSANLTSFEGAHRIKAYGSNNGSEKYMVQEGCEGPWRLEHRNPDGESFAATGPTGQCQGFSYVPFEPGDAQNRTFWWNETQWDEEEQTYKSVPPGEYTWTVRFVVWDEEGDSKVELVASFSIVV